MTHDNTNSGALFGAADKKLLKMGPVNISGQDEQLCIIQVETNSGKTVFQVYQKIGAVFPNDRKETENHPDIKGSIETKSGEMWISGWKKKSQAGQDYTSISVQEKDEQPSERTQGDEAEQGNDDEVPF